MTLVRYQRGDAGRLIDEKQLDSNDIMSASVTNLGTQ